MVRHFVLGPTCPGGKCEMTAVAVIEALGESLSPNRVIRYLTCPAKWYFRYLVGLSEPATGALTLGKAFHATPARNFQQMITGRDVAAGELSEAFHRKWFGAVPQPAVRDDEDAASLPTPGKLLYRRTWQKPRESRTGLHRDDD